MKFAGKPLWVVYFSPAGSTGRIAHLIQNECETLGGQVHLLNLTAHGGKIDLFAESEKKNDGVGIFIGSPVYANHTAPPVLNFISKLPRGIHGFAVPFITWGGVCSGEALYEISAALAECGLGLMGAFKVPAVHSLFRGSNLDPAAGHPNVADEAAVKEFVARIAAKTDRPDARQIDLSELAYRPAGGSDPLLNLTPEDIKRNYPEREIRQDACTQCGICQDACPVDAIRLSPYPEFSSACVYCYNCMHHCPEKAIQSDLSLLRERVLKRAKDIAEPLTARMWL